MSVDKITHPHISNLQYTPTFFYHGLRVNIGHLQF